MFSQSCPRNEGKLNKTDFTAEFPPKCAIKKVLITGKLHQNLLMIVYPWSECLKKFLYSSQKLQVLVRIT